MESVLAKAVVGKVCEMAGQQVSNEISIVWNFTEDFEWLKNRFTEIRCVLNEADEESTRKKEPVKHWLHRVRDIAWEAEDILDEFAVDSMYAKNTQSWLLSFRQMFLRHKMGRRIQNVKSRLSSVVADGNQLNIVRAATSHKEEEAESSSRSEGQQLRRWTILPSDSKAVGIESKIKTLANLLEDPQIPIIGVVGMGGIGKTYLLQHVYNRMKERYEKSAWLSVSQFYSVSMLQRDLVFQLDEDLCKKISKSRISEVVAAESIYSFMLKKRCLVALDDVWRATREGDLLTRLGIPVGSNNQCKILISTRSRKVCVNLDAEIYEMECLTDEDSWMLFCAHAFPNSEENRAPQRLEVVARSIVKKCKNLPLAIKIIAASLKSSTEPGDWESKLSKLQKVRTSNDDPIMVGTSNDDPIMDVLKLSYDSLPAHLKSCFADLSFFPEDEKIECEYLTYLWKGEGFIPAGHNPWDCLEQLASLSLLEVWEEGNLEPRLESRNIYAELKEGRIWGPVKYCKTHDLLLDLAIFISRGNKCAFSVEEGFGGGQWCRLFLAKKDVDEHAISQRCPVSRTLVRTLSLSHNANLRKIPPKLFSGMRVVRILDLSHTRISTLPACVGEMKLLKVLNLRGIQDIQVIPKCVRHLKCLSYLNVPFRAHDIEAPEWIGELRCLQHLEGPFRRLPKGISKLESLTTLRTYSHLSLSREVEDGGVLRIEDLGEMSELQEISFEVSDESQLRRMEESILAPLNKMRRLKVQNCISGRTVSRSFRRASGLPQFPESMSAMRDLEHLELCEFAVPSWICRFTNLRDLWLFRCHCSDYPELQAMPSLVSLDLRINDECRKLSEEFGKSGGFPHLRFFRISCFSKLEEFPEMENGTMASLEELEITDCRNLNKVGEGLERLKTLKEITIGRTGTHVKETMTEGGMYWKKIKDINPKIIITEIKDFNPEITFTETLMFA